MKTLSTNQMVGIESRGFIECAVSASGYGLAAAGFTLACLELAPFIPFLIAGASVYVAAQGVKSNC